jgi:hypothetical protein
MRARWTVVVIALLVLAATTTGRAYWLLGQRWPAGVIPMHLQQGPASGLIDGAPDWDSVTAGALNAWNAVLNAVVFQPMPDPSPSAALQDGTNNVIWGDDVYGTPFGDGVLAITMSVYTLPDNTLIEADVVFNRKINFNSYRGNLRPASGGGVMYDIKRVALHEFGHVLGLTHPDDHGQTVAAIMNSHASNTDALQQDDIDGVTLLYKGPADTLFTGARLLPGQTLTSGQFRLLYQPDGNLVLFDDGAHTVAWSSATGGAGQALMQTDGNFVIYDATGTPRWMTGTGGNNGAHLVLQADGNLVVFGVDGTPLWDRVSAATGTH